MNKLAHISIALLLGISILAATGCASTSPQLDSQFVKTQTSIDLAEESGASEYGEAALERARTSLKSARTAADRKDYDVAMRLAHEAQLDAELAAVQTDRQKVQEALAEINESIETLRNEIARNEQRQGGNS